MRGLLMNFTKKIKNKILDSSDRYDSVKKKNKKLKKQNKLIKKELEDSKSLIKYFIEEKNELEDFVNFCPVCNNVIKFKPFGNPPRHNALCPKCRSLERDRLANFVIETKFSNLLNKPSKVLHFAPELNFYKIFDEKDNVDYYPVDIDPERYEKRNMSIRKQVNMEDIPFIDNYFDFIYNSHVLEHVPNDLQAMSELYRVLKSEGYCLIAVPLSNAPETFQNDKYNTPELRLKHYGQKDHLRIYGNDFKDKLESVGFNVEIIVPENIISSKNNRKIMGLMDGEKLFICTK